MLTDFALGGRWPDLARDMRRLQEEMNRAFGGFRLAVPAEYPPVNVWAGADGAIITAEIPGVAPDQIDITVLHDRQHISRNSADRDCKPSSDIPPAGRHLRD